MDSKSVKECVGTAGNAPVAVHSAAILREVKECPSCGSPDPAKHPAMQFEGEVQPCPNAWHSPQLNRDGSTAKPATGGAA